MNGRWTEIVTGVAVAAAGAAVIAWVFTGEGRSTKPGYALTARFNRADGLEVGGDVRLSGVSVGQVAGERLDEQFRAVVTLRILPEAQLASDTAAVIRTDGLLGGKYVELVPGGSDAIIPPGGQISYTQDAMVMQDLLEMIVARAKAQRGIER